MNTLSISAIILTFNEEKQIQRCIRSVLSVAEEVFIIDSFSSDQTIKLAEECGAKVYQHKWEDNQARQFNWGLENLPIKTEWVLRLDADEYLLTELVEEIKEKLPSLDRDIAGVFLKRRVLFMNRWISHGAYYPTYILRLWRYGAGKYEERWMDEHVKLEQSKTINFQNDFVDDNCNSLSWWTNKHNSYSTREAIDLLNIKYKFTSQLCIQAGESKGQVSRKRWLKENLYGRTPLFLRSFFYFIYRYFLRLGFLDGKEGLTWHFLQAFWYRFLVDAKVFDIERRSERERKKIPEIIREYYGIELD